MSVRTTRIPFDNIVKFGQQTMMNHKLFNVSWILSRFCNYDCSYCWPYAHSKKVDHRPLDVYKKQWMKLKTKHEAMALIVFISVLVEENLQHTKDFCL